MNAQIGDLVVEDVKKRVGDFSLEANFEVKKGDRVGLVGRSGCGKTTLLRLIAGLEGFDGPGDQGRILLGGRDISDFSPQKRDVGFVFQEQALFPDLDVFENVTFGLKVRGVSLVERQKEGNAWLARVGLADKMQTGIGNLSGGEAQRVALIRALIWKPKVLLLDEPFSALDRPLRKSLADEILKLHDVWTVPLILVSHDDEDLMNLATRKLEFKESEGGKVRRVGI